MLSRNEMKKEWSQRALMFRVAALFFSDHAQGAQERTEPLAARDFSRSSARLPGSAYGRQESATSEPDRPGSFGSCAGFMPRPMGRWLEKKSCRRIASRLGRLAFHHKPSSLPPGSERRNGREGSTGKAGKRFSESQVVVRGHHRKMTHVGKPERAAWLNISTITVTSGGER